MWPSTTAVKRALAYWLLAAMKSLQEGDPLTSVAGLDVGRQRFVMEAVGEFVGIRVGFHRFEHGAMVTRSGVIDPEVTFFGEGDDRNVGPHLGFQGIVSVRHWCDQADGDCESSETAFHW
jgi:hypothetical protein